MDNKSLRTLVMTDNRPSDIASFVKGVKNTIGGQVDIASKVVNGFHGSKLNNLKRYTGYFLYPMTLLRKRKQYDVMIGWQQFYANNLAMYCRVLRDVNRGGGNSVSKLYL